MPFPPFRPWLRRSLIALGLLVLLCGLAMWWLPRWLAGSGMRLAGEALGRPVSVGAVSLQPWRLGLVLRELRVAGADAAAPALLEVRELDLALSLRSLWHLSPVLESLTISQPTLRLARLAEGRYDIDDLLQRWTRPSEPAADEPAGFALYNLRLLDGQVLLDDRPYGRRHAVDQLRLELPFLSRLDAHVAVHVQPLLSGRLNGETFSFGGDGLPFAQTREAALNLKLEDLDLQPYLAYWPAELPLKPERGHFHADLRLAFTQAPAKPPELRLSGRLGLRDVALSQPGQRDWLVWQDLRLGLKELQPLQRRLQIDEIVWSGPQLSLRRDAAGALQLPAMPPSREAAPAKPAQPNTAPGWQLELQKLELKQAGLNWQDVGPRAELALQDLGLELSGLRWPLQGQAALRFAARLQGPAKTAPAGLEGRGTLDAEALQLDLDWRDLALEAFSPYLRAQGLPLAVQGRLAGGLGLSLAQPLAPQPEQRLRASLRGLRLDELLAQQLAAGGRREELLRLTTLSLDEVRLDPAARRAELGQLSLQAPRLQLRRAADGRWALLDLLPPEEPKAAATGAPWSVKLAGLAVEQGGLLLSDAAVRPLARREGQGGGEAADGPYQLVVEQLRLQARDLAPGQAARSPVRLSLQLGRPQAASRRFASGPRGASGLGSLQWQGDLALAPLAARGSLRAERLPLQALDPYLDPALGLHLRRAEAGFRGEFSLAQAAEGLRAQARGELLLADLRLLQTRAQADGRREVGEELLSWQALNLAGLNLELQPAQPPRIEVARAGLSDFYARLIVDEQGRFNLRDLGPREAADPAATPVVAAAPASAPALQLKLGEARLSNGSVDFSDRFVRPNYSARLTDLQGSLGAFETGSAALAPLLLKGRVAGTGLLDIGGQINPGTPLAMDIRASASDIELAPLSPYAGKYAGYAIERGKLSTRLHYRVEPGGRLQADNQIVLNQLTFGEKIDSPEATKLPVQLAVALLKDRDGVIDVNLPVSGSLDDPEFSIGGLVLRLLVNLLGKALTSPFALLAGGGGADLSQAEFAPASAALQPDTAANLDKVAKALADRPGLNLTLTGWADAQAERAALQAARVEQSLLAERRREQRRQQNAEGAAATAAEQALSPAERLRLLRVVYQNSNLPGRPRNLIGLLKDLPPEQMQAMLAASHAVDEEAARQLALQRAVAVRDALLAKGVPNARLFLAGPRLHEAAAGASADAKPWSPRVDLALAAQ